jgi:hypothetical protein
LAKRGKNVEQGRQQPRLSWVPPCVDSSGQEAVELAHAAGLHLDPWEELVLRESLGERQDGKWSAFEVGVMVSRQNGKGSILEARELAGLFLLGERLIVHSAHLFDTSLEHFRRLKHLIEGTPEFSRRVKKNGIKNSHGEEGIELIGGQRIRFRTRTKGGGRGFSADLLVFDEAMVLPESSHNAILPTLSARPNPQVWYAGSAVDQWIHEHGVVFAGVRERGLEGGQDALAYFEWSAAGVENPQEAADIALDRNAWAEANPGFGIRISDEYIENEQRSLTPRGFAVERLGIGDWPRTDGFDTQVIAPETWAARRNVKSAVKDPVRLAFDVSPDRASAAIGIAGKNAEGKWHVEVVDRRRGTGWVVPELIRLLESHGISEPMCDGIGPAGSLVPQLEEKGIDVETLTGREHAEACGAFYDECAEGGLCHIGQESLDSAIKGASQRSLGDAWLWSRKSSATDITPLVACTIALRGAMQGNRISVYADRDLLILD